MLLAHGGEDGILVQRLVGAELDVKELGDIVLVSQKLGVVLEAE
jgi:hypothetical protein